MWLKSALFKSANLAWTIVAMCLTIGTDHACVCLRSVLTVKIGCGFSYAFTEVRDSVLYVKCQRTEN